MTAMGEMIEFSRQEVSISAGHAESMPTSEHFFTGKKRAQKSAVTPVIRGLNHIKLLVSCRLLWSDPDLYPDLLASLFGKCIPKTTPHVDEPERTSNRLSRNQVS